MALCASVVPADAEIVPQQNWQSIRTPHFYVLGNAGEGRLRDVAQRLEQFREATALLLPKAVHDSPVETTVLVFRSHGSYEPFKPLYQGKTRTMIAGYFQRTPTRNYITLTTEGGLDNLRTVYHEYFHLLVNNTLSGVPLWFNEGLAEYYESFEVFDKGRRGALGKYNSDHILLLRQRFLPLDTLVRVGHGSPEYNEDNRAGVFYAESWALVHFLALGDDQKLAPGMGTFVATLSEGASLDEAARKAFGIGGKELEQKLRSYVHGEQFKSQRVQFTERIGAVERVPATPVGEPEVHATLADLLLHTGRPDEAVGHLDHALSVDPAFSPAHTAYALLYSRQGKPGLARDHLKRAVQGSGATYLSSYQYARALIEAWTDDATNTISIGEVEAALRRTIELNPDFPDAYELLAWYRARDDTDEAILLMQRAIALVPGREDYVLTLARLLVTKEDTAGPIIMDRLAKTASNPDVRASAEREMARLEAIERRRAAGEEHRARVEETRPAHGDRASSGGDAAVRSFEVIDRGGDGSAVPGEPVRLADLHGSLPTDAPASDDGFVPQYRDLGPGERRLKGRLLSILCDARGVTVRADIDGEIAKLHAESFDAVDFITYRDDLSGRIECGPRLDHDQVFVTFRPEAEESLVGTLVAVEFLRK